MDAAGDNPPPLPFLENKPELDDGLAFFWRGFVDLSTDRPVGFAGAGAIPWSAIDRYARRHGLADPDDFEAFATLIRAMDAAWLDHQEELRPKTDKG